MRYESSVTSVSWIPSESINSAAMRSPFELGVMHYDDPPPDEVDDLEALRRADRFRFANDLRAWVEVDEGRITSFGYSGQGHMGSTTVRLGRRELTFPAVAFPDIQLPPEVTEDAARFVQTSGGRPSLPGPRVVGHPPFVQYVPPTVWTTLALTLRADGSSEHQLLGASPFPRHWVFDRQGTLVGKSGLADFQQWWRYAFGQHTPWGNEDSPALLTPAETALERELSTLIMRGGARPVVRGVRVGETVTEQGQPGAEVFLLLNGVLSVEVDGEQLAEVGPGAILGERAVLEGGMRTATLRAVTPCTLAVAARDQLDRSKLEELSTGHRREERASAPSDGRD